jgi:GDP-D-mannose 3',5'-epimerase
MKTALVLGSSGFIGGHLVKRLKAEGYWVRGVDLVPPPYNQPNEFICGDLRDPQFIKRIVVDKYQEPFYQSKPFDEVYQLAADMGGAGYVFTGEHDADIMHNSAAINLNICEALKDFKETKVFYSSSACMYPQEIQGQTNNPGLKETDAYPGNPDSEYGWEKLFSERLFLAYQRNYNLNVRIARFHNIYGPEGTYKGGREKAPAAICRKVIERNSNFIEVWGDGEQTRSFLYIDDCIEAVRRLMESDFAGPVNIGSEEMVSINELAELVCCFTGNKIEIRHIDGPTGVRGRNSDNTLIFEKLLWKPKYTLFEGMEKTYWWIKSQYDGTASN